MVPLTPPRRAVEPSPKFTSTLSIVCPLPVATFAVTVKLVALPAAGVPVTAMDTVGLGAEVTTSGVVVVLVALSPSASNAVARTT